MRQSQVILLYLLENVLDEAIKMILLTLPLSSALQEFVTKWEVCIKLLCCLTRPGHCYENSICEIELYCLFQGTTFLLGSLIVFNGWRMFSWKWVTDLSLSFEESNWQVFVTNAKNLSVKIRILKKLTWHLKSTEHLYWHQCYIYIWVCIWWK